MGKRFNNINDAFKGLSSDNKGDKREAEQYLYYYFYSTTKRIVQKNNGSYTDIKDTHQNAMLAFFDNIKSNKYIKVPECKIKTYFYKIAFYKFVDIYKSNHRISLTDSVENEEWQLDNNWLGNNTDSLINERYKKELVKILLKQSSESCLEIFTMFYIKELDYSEMLEISEYKSIDSLKSTKANCLKKIREIYKRLNINKESWI